MMDNDHTPRARARAFLRLLSFHRARREGSTATAVTVTRQGGRGGAGWFMFVSSAAHGRKAGWGWAREIRGARAVSIERSHFGRPKQKISS
jgi:hypothetical protein